MNLFRISNFLLRICLVFLISCFVFEVKHINAQSVGLSVSPPVVEILLSPNKKVEQTYIIKNQGQSVLVTPNFHTFTPNGTQGHGIVSPTPLTPSQIPLIATLSHPLNQPIQLDANSSLSLTLTLEGSSVDTPVDTYLALVLTPSLASNISNLTTTSPAISALALVTLAPSAFIPADLDVEDFTIPLFHDSYIPLVINPTLKNQGDIMLRPEGSFQIFTPSNKLAHEQALYPHLLLKQSKRLIQGRDDATPPGAQPLSWSPPWYTIGPHRLVLNIHTIGGTKLVEVERVIWLLPIRAIISFGLLAIVISILLIRQRKLNSNETRVDTSLK